MFLKNTLLALIGARLLVHGETNGLAAGSAGCVGGQRIAPLFVAPTAKPPAGDPFDALAVWDEFMALLCPVGFGPGRHLGGVGC